MECPLKRLAPVPLLAAFLSCSACQQPRASDVDEAVSTGSADSGAVAGPLHDANAQGNGGAGNEAGAER
jgi:hypothetical protein